MELKEYREQIDRIDAELVRLFQERMKVSAAIGAYKKENGLAVLDKSREREKLASLVGSAEEELQSYVHVLYSLIFELSRSYQTRLTGEKTPLQRRITEAVETTPRLFPPRAEVACQGVDGAYSQIACEKLFSMPSILYFNSFESVFAAIDQGLCTYGVLPLENSTAGSVNAVYDLMMQHNFVAPNINLENPDEYSEKINLTAKTVDMELNAILSNSFGFGGTNSALIIQKVL